MKRKFWIYPLVIMGMLLMFTNGCNNSNVTDIDGNVYHTVTIGTQTWMKENLKVTHYNNGDPINNGTGIGDYSGEWVNPGESEPKYSKYFFNYYDDPAFADVYGRLYTWFAVIDNRGICPTGWHVPSEAEWKTLITYLGGESVASNKLKETGTTHWQSNTGATNESGFTALPGGFRSFTGPFKFITLNGVWWSSTEYYWNSTEYYAILVWCPDIQCYRNDVYGTVRNKIDGFSVRCVKN